MVSSRLWQLLHPTSPAWSTQSSSNKTWRPVKHSFLCTFHLEAADRQLAHHLHWGKTPQIILKKSLSSAMDSHPVTFFLCITGKQTPKPWFPSCLPCPTPVCSSPVRWQIIEGYKSTAPAPINNLPGAENKRADLVGTTCVSQPRNKSSTESLAMGSLASSAACVCWCFKN